jgi:hypothetical protein
VSATQSDVNGDGLTDLTVQFVMSTLHLSATSTSARLSASIQGTGQLVLGSDAVTIVPAAGPVVVIHNDGTGYAQSQWSPSGFMVQYSLANCADSVTDRCNGTLNPNTAGQVVRITSDEVMPPSGMTIDSSSTFSVQSWRLGNGDGRVYTVTFNETDSLGNVTQSQCKIQVPKNQNGGNAIDSGVHTCVGTGC